MSRIELDLEIDNCCGGGHCGPVPGYFYVCPHCSYDTNCPTYHALKVGDKLKCNFCNGEIESFAKISDTRFEFEIIPKEEV